MTTTSSSQLITTRRTITTVSSYEAAERAVDHLSDEGFPVEHLTIVGTGLRYVEQVSGRLTNGRATALGTGYGALLGLFWGLLFGLFFTVDSGSFFGVLAYSLIVGVVFGAVAGLLGHLVSGGRRDFTSTSTTRADRYEVQVDEDFADSAEKLLANISPR
jgi:hypothetical protein